MNAAEKILNLFEGLKAEPNIKRVIEIDEYGWTGTIYHKCLNAYTHKDWWNESSSITSEDFIGVLDFFHQLKEDMFDDTK